MTLVEFLLARIAEDEERADFVRRQTEGNNWSPFEPWKLSWHDEYDLLCIEPSRALAECEAKRRIVELHKSWPVLVEQQPEFDFSVSDGTIDGTTLRMSKRIAWLTEQEYRSRFGSEPPTAPMLAALAGVYADHPDYDETWRL